MMRFGDPLDDGEAQAEAAVFAGAGFIGAEESLEVMGRGLGRNSDAGSEIGSRTPGPARLAPPSRGRRGV